MGKVKVSDLIPDDKNYNKGNEYGESLIAKSFQKFGAGRSILLDKNGKVIAGNKSLQKFAEQGGEDVTIVESDGKKLIAVKRTDIDLDTPQGREMALADNSTAKYNIEWDFPALELAIAEFDLKPLDWGIKMPHEVSEDDYQIPDEIITDIVAGDLFEIGQHRLLCGDSTKAEDVEKAMGGQKADITFTSPPYNAGKNHLGGNKKMKESKYIGSTDDLDDDEYLSLLVLSTQNAIDNSDVVCYNIQPLAGNKFVLPKWVNHFAERLIDRAIWYKGSGQPQQAARVLNSRFEDLYFFSGEKDRPSRAFPKASFHGNQSNVYEGRGNSGENKESGSHAATMPIHLPNWILSVIDEKGETVYDPFLGSGTTMVAGHQLNRKVIGIEISPQYVQICVERMLKLDPSLEIKRNGKAYKLTGEKQVENAVS